MGAPGLIGAPRRRDHGRRARAARRRLYVHRQPGRVDRRARSDPRLGSRLRRRQVRGDRQPQERDGAPAAGRVHATRGRASASTGSRSACRERRDTRAWTSTGSRWSTRPAPIRSSSAPATSRRAAARAIRRRQAARPDPGHGVRGRRQRVRVGHRVAVAKCYGPTWGRFKWRTRPVPGNHDYLTAGAAPYFAYFGARAGTAGPGLVRLRRRDVARLQPEFELRDGRRLRSRAPPRRRGCGPISRRTRGRAWRRSGTTRCSAPASMAAPPRRDRCGTPCTTPAPTSSSTATTTTTNDSRLSVPTAAPIAGDRDPRVRRRHRRHGTARPSRRSAPTPRSARRACSGSSSSS